MIEAVIFDMDGLLIDTEPIWRKVEIEKFRKAGLELTEDDCRQTMGMRLDEVVKYWHSRHPWNSPSKEELHKDILDGMEKAIMEEGEPLPGAIEAVRSAKRMGLKTAIASSSPKRLIDATTERLGIAKCIDLSVTAWGLAYGKPHPEVFLVTAEKLGVTPEKCLVLEDSFHGMIGALAAKMKTWVVPENPEDERYRAAQVILPTLENFPDRLNELISS